MKIVPIAEVKAKFSEYIRQCATEPVVITKNGRPSALLTAITDEDDLEGLLLVHNSHFQKMLKEAEKRIRRGQGIDHEAFWESLD